jgi:hypothetical protein
MTAEEQEARERELTALAQSNPAKLIALYHKTHGAGPGLPPHFSFAALIRAIIEHERQSGKLS